MKNIFFVALIALGLASCTQDSFQEAPQLAMVMPANPEFVEVAPTISVIDTCEIDVDGVNQFTCMLFKVNGTPVAAPIVATVTIDLSGPVPTATAVNPYATGPVEWLNGQLTPDLLFFDIPFTLSDGTVEYVTSSLSYNPTTQAFSIYTGNTSDGNYYEFVGSLICE